MSHLKVFIYPNFDKTHSLSCTEEAVLVLLEIGCEVLMPAECREKFQNGAVVYTTVEEGVQQCGIMISVGGDGTILKCARYASRLDKELLGINCGRLGFMATLERGELSLLSRLVSGDYLIDERMMLDAEVVSERGERVVMTALNEAVISSGYGSGIHDFTVLADGLTVSSLRADGLIFSTPTGASGYSLSAGGPLIEPTLDCIEFTQICPHSLFARTMLFSPEKQIEVRFKAEGWCAAELRVDGRRPLLLSERDKLYLRRSPLRLKLIDILGGGYFRAVSHKLMRPAKQENDNGNEEK